MPRRTTDTTMTPTQRLALAEDLPLARALDILRGDITHAELSDEAEMHGSAARNTLGTYRQRSHPSAETRTLAAFMAAIRRLISPRQRQGISWHAAVEIAERMADYRARAAASALDDGAATVDEVQDALAADPATSWMTAEIGLCRAEVMGLVAYDAQRGVWERVSQVGRPYDRAVAEVGSVSGTEQAA